MFSKNFCHHLRHSFVNPGRCDNVVLNNLTILGLKTHLRKILSANMSNWSIPLNIERGSKESLGNTLNDFDKLVKRMSQFNETGSKSQSFISRISNDPLSRHDQTTDGEFYSFPRFVTHIDDHAIDSLTSFYSEHLKENSIIVDLCSSWISHLPRDKEFQKVIGIGMNENELKANKRLDVKYVCDLNTKHSTQNNNLLPMLEKDSVNHVLCAVSIDYLIQPITVFHEVLRVLKPSSGSTFIISFSNRCFPTKAIKSWLETDDAGRIGIVCSYFQESNTSNHGNWKNIKVFDLSKDDRDDHPSSPHYSDPLFVVTGEKV